MAGTRSSSQARLRGDRPPRRSGSDEAPDAVLDLPGSAEVSCLLMQDAVAADVVSVRSGGGTVALFANPFLDGKEEALVVDESGELTYLRRTGSQTGWEQSPVVGDDGKSVSAREVVVVRHPQDRTLWAIYSDGATARPRGLRLVSTPTGDGAATSTWQADPHVVDLGGGSGVRGVSHLYTYYDGRSPVIVCTEVTTGKIINILVGSVRTTRSYRFFAVDTLTWVPDPGAVEDLAGGYVRERGSLATPPQGGAVCYVRVGSELTRYTRYDSVNSVPAKPLPIAGDATKLVGVYRSYNHAEMGCLYLDGSGNLVTWNPAIDVADGQYTYTELGLRTATSWLDVDGMIHVYGLDRANTLKVLHQASWDSSGAPIWSTADIPTAPLEPRYRAAAGQQPGARAADDTVPSCVPLVPKVAMFVVDPFPGRLPTQLVKLEGIATPGDQFALHTQDVTSSLWSRDKIRLPSSGRPHLVSHYVSTVTVLDRRGNPMPALPVDVSAETLVEIQADGASYLVGPGHSARLATGALGRVTIATPADSLLPATLHVDAPGLAQGAVIQPAAAVHDYLGGSGTLPSQKGFFTAGALRDAGIVDPKHHASLDGVVASTKNLFALANGGQATSKLFRGAGAAPRIRGFAVGSAPSHPRAADTTVGYTEFASAAEVRRHMDGIRALPEYGGVWEDFTAWASDVWEGIKNGVVEVYEVVVETVTSVFVWIGKKIVELVGFVVDSIATAVRAVEAVFREVVDTIVKVVDWLKALFDFNDIWDTKRALEACLHLTLGYLSTTVSHYGDELHGWFGKKEADAHALFETLKDEFRTRPIGDAANQIPAVTNTSGQVIAPQDLRDNPQATWLLDRVFTSGAVAAASLDDISIDIDPKLTEAWDHFVAKVSDAEIVNDFGAILGDLNTVLAQFADPADPELAAKTSLSALIDILDRLVHIGLTLADLALQAVVALVVALVDSMDVLLATRLPLGPINALYEWVQTQAGIEDPDELTLGGLLCLIAAFAVTTVYKLVNGVDQAPFPGGYLPPIPPPDWDARDASGVQVDVDFARVKTYKAVCGIIMSVGAATNATADVAPLYKKCFTPFSSCLVAGINFLATSFDSFALLPPLNDKSQDRAAIGAFAYTAIEAALQLGTLAMFMNGSCKRPAFKNVDEDIVWGPIVTTILSGLQIGFIASGDLPNTYTKLMKGLGAIPGLDQFARIGIIKDEETGPYRAGTVSVINLFAGLTSALMLATSAFLPGPDIPQQVVPPGKVGEKYEFRIERTGESVCNTPLKWTKIGTLPEGLEFDDATGVVSGIPKKAESTTCTFTCTDSFSPPQSATRDGFGFTIEE